MVPIVLPPLRERAEDIPLLLDHFVQKFSAENKKQIKGVSKEALDILKNYEWPGNVRELENLVERVVTLTVNSYIQPSELPFSLLNVPKMNGLKESILTGRVSLIEGEEKFEKEIIEDALRRANYVQSHAAEMLGVSRRILKYKMDKFGITQGNEKSSSE